MRTACWVSALLLLCGCSRPPTGSAAAQPRLEVAASTENGHTRLELRRQDAAVGAVAVERDDTVAADAAPAAVEVIGEMPGAAVVIADRYPSAPGGLSFCQAGDEQFLRVISLAGARPAQTLAVKVASCRDNLELLDPGLEWVANGSIVRIHWLTGPSGAPELRAFQIAADGTAHLAPAP